MSDLTLDLSIPFPTEREADVAYQVLRVDKEPPRGGCKKTLSVDEKTLKVKFTAKEAQKMRVGMTSFFNSLILVVETIDTFGPPASVYNHYN